MDESNRRREIFEANLITSVTREDFDAIASELVLFHEHRREEELHKLIGKPEVLAGYLAYYRGRKGEIFFRNVCKHFCKLDRVDYLQCFVGYVDFSLFFRHDVHGNHNYYINYIARYAPMDVATFFLDQGLDPNIEVAYENTPILHSACLHSKRDLVELLIQRGADVKKTNSNGATAARGAVRCGDVRVLDILIMNGIDLMSEDKNELWKSHFGGVDSYEITQRLLDMNITPPEDVIFQVTYWKRIMKGREADFNHLRRMITLFRSLGYREPTDLELNKFTPEFIWAISA